MACCVVVCKLTIFTSHCPFSYRPLPTIVISFRRVLCVARSVFTGITWPEAVTSTCDLLPTATQFALHLAGRLLSKNRFTEEMA